MSFEIRNSDDDFARYRVRREMAYTPDEDERAVQDGQTAQVHGTDLIKVKQVGTFRKMLSGLFGFLGLSSFLSIFIMAFLLMPWLEEHDMEWLLVTAFGGAFFSIGMAIWCGGAGAFPLLFVLVGGVVMCVSLLFGLGDDALQALIIEKGVPCLAGLAFLCVGLGMLVVPRVMHKKRKARYTLPVTAVVTDKEERRSRDHEGHYHTYHYLTWRYMAGGREYTYKSGIGRSPEKREPGYAGQLWLDPWDPGSVWEGHDKTIDVLLTVMGIVFSIAGCFVLYMFLGLM